MDGSDSAQDLLYRTLSRRRLLQGAAATAATLSALGRLSINPASAAPQCPRYGVFDSHTFETLSAVAAQIVPTDTTPGATEICAASFIELNAAGNASLADLLTNGMAALDQSSNLLYGANFVNLSFASQTAVLQQLEAGTAPGTLWNSAANRNNFTASPGQPTPAGLRQVMGAVATPAGPIAKRTPNLNGLTFQQVVFGTCRNMTKLAWVINWPEAFVRDPSTGQPFFADAAHLISDPDVPNTGTCWDTIRFNVIDYQTETLLWAWQAGLKVTGFDHGWPKFAGGTLNDNQRLSARDQLYQLSNQGIA
jgi:hypothetical protein